MSVVFADTFYFLGLTNPGDQVHAKCVSFARQHRGEFLTTSAVLLEYANAASKAAVSWPGRSFPRIAIG